MTPPAPRRVVFPPLRLLSAWPSARRRRPNAVVAAGCCACCWSPALILAVARPLLNARGQLRRRRSRLSSSSTTAGRRRTTGRSGSDEAYGRSTGADRARSAVVLVADRAAAADGSASGSRALLPAAEAREAGAGAAAEAVADRSRRGVAAAASSGASRRDGRRARSSGSATACEVRRRRQTGRFAALLERLAPLGQLTVCRAAGRQPAACCSRRRRARRRPRRRAVRPAVGRRRGRICTFVARRRQRRWSRETGRFAEASDGPRCRSSCRPSCSTASPASTSRAQDGGGRRCWSTSAGSAAGRPRRRACRRPRAAAARRVITISSGRSQPFAEVRHGDVADLLARALAVLVLTDVGTPGRGDGGEPSRRGSSRAACCCASPDRASPARLRSTIRCCRWRCAPATARSAAPCHGQRPAARRLSRPTSPFAGLTVAEDVEIRRQVLAEPRSIWPSAPGRGSTTARR